jgi:hypothetical protein
LAVLLDALVELAEQHSKACAAGSAGDAPERKDDVGTNLQHSRWTRKNLRN